MKKSDAFAPTAATSLRLDWCSHEAARYAVEKWHYSRRMPRNKLAKIGVWEDERFIGAVLFGPGASNALGKPFGAGQMETCELLRVALTTHRTPVTRVVAIAIKMTYKAFPGLRLIVSFADPREGHYGVIYQGGNWIYTGKTADDKVYYDKNGTPHHSRNVKATSYRDRNGVVNYARSLMVRVEVTPGKHRYLYPLDAAMRRQIEPLRKPYPKRAASIDSDAPGVQPGDGGASPTAALQPPTQERADA